PESRAAGGRKGNAAAAADGSGRAARRVEQRTPRTWIDRAESVPIQAEGAASSTAVRGASAACRRGAAGADRSAAAAAAAADPAEIHRRRRARRRGYGAAGHESRGVERSERA